MNIDDNKESKAEEVMKAIQVAAAGFGKENEGIDLLAIVKKVARNRKKGESLE